MWNIVVALYSYFLFGLILLVALPTVALLRVAMFWDKNHLAAGRLLRLCAVLTAKVCPIWRLQMDASRGRPKGGVVVVSNHESTLDILLISSVPWEMKWVAKASLFKVPWLGWLFRLAGDIPVHRGDKDSGSEALRLAEQYLARGCPVMFFPEGTRSLTDELRPFKLGAFKTAIRAQVPILPLVVHGTRDGMPVGDPWIRKAAARGRVLEAIDTRGMDVGQAQALADRVREVILQGRAQLEREMGLSAEPVASASAPKREPTEA